MRTVEDLAILACALFLDPCACKRYKSGGVDSSNALVQTNQEGGGEGG